MKRTALIVSLVLVSLVGPAGCSKKEKAPPAPPTADALFEQGKSAVENGNLGEGLKLFDAALKLDPDHPRSHCAIGTVYRLKGDYTKAIEKYDKALELDPDYFVCMDNLGIAYIDIKEYEKAEEMLRRAAATDPAYADCHFNLGRLYTETGRIPEAIAELERYVSLSKNEKKIEETKAKIEELKAGTAGKKEQP